METTYPNSPQNSTYNRYERSQTTAMLDDFERREAHTTQKDFAAKSKMPRTTFQSQLYNKRRLEEKYEEAAFFQSSTGEKCLCRIVAAAQFVLTQRAGGSVHLVKELLQLSKLNRFIGSSVGAQYAAIKEMEELIGKFGDTEGVRLTKEMKPKILILALDETFHPTICLVAMDPLTGYILLEKYVERRDTETWQQALEKALAGLPVRIVQCVSDEAKALVSLVEKELGVHHAPDLFHVLNDLVKATSLALSNQSKRAEKAYVEAGKEVEKQEQRKTTYEAEQASRGPGRPPNFAKEIEVARKQQVEKKALWDSAVKRAEDVNEARKKVSRAYHLCDLKTGEAKLPQEAKAEMKEAIEEIKQHVEEAGLGDKSKKRLSKAIRMVPKLSATLSMVHNWLVIALIALKLSREVEAYVYRVVLPGYYLLEVARKARTAEEKKELEKRAHTLLEPWKSRDGPLANLRETDIKQVEQVVQQCILLFVRASSCVEGRNSHLRRHYRSAHRLSERKLKALTVVHNYYIKRRDDTTAAERFFEAKPRELFEYLLQNMSTPPRPRKVL